MLSALFVGAALAQPRDPVQGQARDVATLIGRAELGAGRVESPENWRLRAELSVFQRLLQQALIDATEGTESGALAILGAECQRLLPRVRAVTEAQSGASIGDWERIASGLTQVCAKRDELSAAADPGAKRALAQPLLERVRRAPDPSRKRVGPTIRFPYAAELRPSAR
jgi:hypothetical protein